MVKVTRQPKINLWARSDKNRKKERKAAAAELGSHIHWILYGFSFDKLTFM
jgi:hypothetical protein